MEANEIQFHYKDHPPNRSSTRERVAICVFSREKRYIYSSMTIIIGADVMKLLGWKTGYDRVQFERYGEYTAIGRQCGQFKLHSTGGGGRQTQVTASARYFNENPIERMGITPVDWSIKKMKNGEKVLLIPPINEILQQPSGAQAS